MAVHDAFAPRPESASDSSHEALERFGPFALFKLLRRNALGEVYRAGLLGRQAVQRVVSLRLFNGRTIEGERFWQLVQSRRDLGAALSGGPFSEVVDIGLEAGVPYVAQDFVFGRSLAEIVERSRASSNPIPLEHSLLVMDRIANALRNAYQTRIDGERVIHGFLVPEFVHLSTEGELTLGGFESSEALLAYNSAPEFAAFGGYLSPEVQQNQPPQATDDVYALGAIFAELLTGEPLPPLNPTEASRWLESAVLAYDGTPLSDDVRQLLRESLLPRTERLANAEAWHKQLVDVISATGSSPTTFNLAFYMHTLFGEELDREEAVVAAERSAAPASTAEPQSAPPAPQAQAVAEPPMEASPSPPVDSSASSAAAESATYMPLDPPVEPAPEPASYGSPAPSPGSQAAGRSNRTRSIGIAAVAILLLGGGTAFFLLRSPDASPAVDTAAAAGGPALAEPAEPAAEIPLETSLLEVVEPTEIAPRPEELQDQVRSLVAQRAGDLEESLKAEYDQRLLDLRQQLEEAREQQRASAQAAQQPAPQVAEPPTPAESATSHTSQPPATSEPPATRPAQSPVSRPSASTGDRANAETTSAGASSEPASDASTPGRSVMPPGTSGKQQPSAAGPKSSGPAAQPENPQRTDPAPASPAVASPVPQVRPGSIVTAGPGVKQPRLVRQPRVIYPPAAARLNREATVRVRVLVDENGKPAQIEQLSGEIGLGFDRAALQAAKTTKWTPPSKNGVPVKMWVELSIDFRP